MSGRCMSSRIRSGGRRAAIAARAVQAGGRDAQLDLRPLRQDAAHHLGVGLVVLDVVHIAAAVARQVRLERRPAARRRSASSRRAAAASSTKVEPSPSDCSRAAMPPISSASRWLMTSPMPVPSMPLGSRPSRLKGWNSSASCCVAHARPGVDDVDLDRRPGRAGARSISTRPPSTLYLTALDSRLVRICLTRVWSPSTGARGRRRCCSSMLMPRSRACVSTMPRAAATSGARSSAARVPGAACPTRCATGRACR